MFEEKNRKQLDFYEFSAMFEATYSGVADTIRLEPVFGIFIKWPGEGYLK